MDSYRRRQTVWEPPPARVDVFAVNRSFVYNRLAHGNPWHGVVAEEETVYGPLASKDYRQDARFVSAVESVKRSGIPFVMIHIPAFPEIEGGANGDFSFGRFGVPAERERSLAQSLELATGQPIVHLYRDYDAAVKSDPLALVYGRDNSHPSPKGVEAMAAALERIVLETGALAKPAAR